MTENIPKGGLTVIYHGRIRKETPKKKHIQDMEWYFRCTLEKLTYWTPKWEVDGSDDFPFQTGDFQVNHVVPKIAEIWGSLQLKVWIISISLSGDTSSGAKMKGEQPGTTWRIIPVSKWLVTTIYKPWNGHL